MDRNKCNFVSRRNGCACGYADTCGFYGLAWREDDACHPDAIGRMQNDDGIRLSGGRRDLKEHVRLRTASFYFTLTPQSRRTAERCGVQAGRPYAPSGKSSAGSFNAGRGRAGLNTTTPRGGKVRLADAAR